MAFHADDLIYDTGSGGDYDDLAAFEAAYDGIDISATDGVRARVRGETTDGATVDWTGWQAGQDADCKIVITADKDGDSSLKGIQERSGWTGGDGAGTDAIIGDRQSINETTNPICIDIYNIESIGYLFFDCQGNNNIIRIWNCLIRDTGDYGITFYSHLGTTTVYLANLLVRDWSTANWKNGIYINDANVTAYGWNITMYTGEYGVYENAGSIEARNIVGANTDSNVFASMSDENYCAADDASTGGANSINNITVADEFTNAGADDFTVKDTNADIYHAGADQPAWFDTLTGGNDIVGNAWDASNPSIGCFEYVSGGTTTAPTTLPPTTLGPTTLAPTTLPPTTLAPTTLAPTTLPPTTLAPTTLPPTTLAPTTLAPTTIASTTISPSTLPPTTLAPTTLGPTTIEPTTIPPTTLEPTTLPPTTLGPTTPTPTTEAPTTLFHTTVAPATTLTTLAPTTAFEPVARRRGIKDFGFSFRDRWRN